MRYLPARGLPTVCVAIAISVCAELARAAGGAAACPPEGWSRESLLAVKTAHWKLEDAPRRDALAAGLLPCLASPDPVLRDGIAFEGLSAFMRAGQLSNATLQAILRTLVAQLAPAGQDSAGFAQPFAALALSEVARVDRMRPFLSPNERAALIDAAVNFLSAVRDYRGFDATDGWRHAVAHGADLLMQLALNPAVGRADHDRILNAVAAQAAPPGEHFYIYGEGERLARPVLLIARRGTLDAPAWSAWIKRVSSPGPFNDWEAALQTQAGLARRHNLTAFLLVLYASLREGQDEAARQTLLPAVVDAVRSLP
jgi:Protein of unknown function (DUF2785)